LSALLAEKFEIVAKFLVDLVVLRNVIVYLCLGFQQAVTYRLMLLLLLLQIVIHFISEFVNSRERGLRIDELRQVSIQNFCCSDVILLVSKLLFLKVFNRSLHDWHLIIQVFHELLLLRAVLEACNSGVSIPDAIIFD